MTNIIKEKEELIQSLAYNYQFTPRDILEILRVKGYKIQTHTLEEKVEYYRLGFYIERFKQCVRRGNMRQTTFDSIIRDFTKYYDEGRYEVIKDYHDKFFNILIR